MDIQMPRMDGYQATAAIREKEKACGGHIPIIALTADSLQGHREQCLAAGMDAHLAKPIRREELARVLSDVLKFPLPLQATETSSRS
jgi:CheY-like chemotaxis protein